MPTYEYQCKNCGHELEELQSMSEPPLLRCPKCGKDTLARIMGTGGGLIFKGSGFYRTDYMKTGGPTETSSTPKGKKGDKAANSAKTDSGSPDAKQEKESAKEKDATKETKPPAGTDGSPSR